MLPLWLHVDYGVLNNAVGAAVLKYEKISAYGSGTRAKYGGSSLPVASAEYPFVSEKTPGFSRPHFLLLKRVFDIGMSLLLLPIVGLVAMVLIVLNPARNPGPLFFVQERMGRDCVRFRAVKFRTMTPTSSIQRSADCPVEADRITPLGRFLRRSRLDELPQVINVLRGEMSLIGPRPDYFEHACHFLKEVPGYRERHSVRPGISGLAQTEVGYVQGTEATRHKVHADLHYISHSGFRLEAWIVWRTLAVVAGRLGS